jgi:hypothetical protein
MTKSILLSMLFVTLLAGSAWAVDSDGDGVDDTIDNCTYVANPNQIDSNYDGFGNYCDADLFNDNIVNAVDFEIFIKCFVQAIASGPLPCEHSDFDSDGYVLAGDFGVVMSPAFGSPPGPSGLACAGTFPCSAATFVGDVDGDGVADDIDNCVDDSNADQNDHDGDGYGTRCDPDFNNDMVVDAVDSKFFLECFTQTFASGPLPCEHADFDGDGYILAGEFNVLIQAIGGPPGPAGPGAQTTASCTPAEGNCPTPLQ